MAEGRGRGGEAARRAADRGKGTVISESDSSPTPPPSPVRIGLRPKIRFTWRGKEDNGAVEKREGFMSATIPEPAAAVKSLKVIGPKAPSSHKVKTVKVIGPAVAIPATATAVTQIKIIGPKPPSSGLEAKTIKILAPAAPATGDGLNTDKIDLLFDEEVEKKLQKHLEKHYYSKSTLDKAVKFIGSQLIQKLPICAQTALSRKDLTDQLVSEGIKGKTLQCDVFQLMSQAKINNEYDVQIIKKGKGCHHFYLRQIQKGQAAEVVGEAEVNLVENGAKEESEAEATREAKRETEYEPAVQCSTMLQSSKEKTKVEGEAAVQRKVANMEGEPALPLIEKGKSAEVEAKAEGGAAVQRKVANKEGEPALPLIEKGKSAEVEAKAEGGTAVHLFEQVKAADKEAKLALRLVKIGKSAEEKAKSETEGNMVTATIKAKELEVDADCEQEGAYWRNEIDI